MTQMPQLEETDMVQDQALADKQPTEQERREAERLRWLERAEATLDTAKDVAEGARVPDPAFLARHLKMMVDRATEAECLTPDDRQSLTLRTKALELTAYERAFDQLLIDGRAAIRGNHKEALGALLKTAADHMAELRKRGMGVDGITSLKEKIEILRQTSHAGDSEKAKAPEKDIGPKPFANDRRMFMRYGDPSLIVEIAGRRFQTTVWSLGGALIAGVERLPAPIGKLILVKIKVEAGHLLEERATIVRHDAEKKEFALQFRRFGSSLIAIKRECESLGMDPS
jgi:hypothetical protein